ncbi:MATE family efflux transporter [Halobellus litoreus]|uniref:MATE family efflux transporter n=1 Tax=Halobellus litoreus TaxID=755310 RepID=A0ABD6DXF2_9EURY|nr:MATE family efflux transporter [Halobellus litoreus]
MSLLDRIDSLLKGPEELNLTSGGIAKPLFYLSLPIVITNLLQTAYNLADTFWLGQFSTEALAAISFAFPMVFLLISLGMGLSVAGSVLVAQHIGADEEDEAEYAASQTVAFSIIGSIILGFFGYFAVGPFIGFLGASPAVHPLATGYMQVISAGMPFMFGFFVFIALMRGYGDTVTPMLVMFGSVVLNIAIDPILIFGFDSNPLFGMLGMRGLEATLLAATGYTGSGITGAAIATVFSRALAFIVGIAVMLQGVRGVMIHPSQMRPNFAYLRQLLDIGLPASVEVTGRSLSVNLLLLVVGMFPTTVVASFGIGVRVFSVIFLPAIAVARGVETMTGQNIGAEKPERAGAAADFAAKTMFVVLTAMGAIALFAAEPIVAVFTNDPAVIEEGGNFLRYVAPSFGFIGVMRAYTGSFRGAGRTLTAAAISVIMLGLIRIPVAYGASLSWGAEGIWLAFPISNVAGALIAFAWYRRGSWQTGSVRRPTPADD